MMEEIIKPAHRTELVTEYYFASKLAEIADMRKEGREVINLGIGSPDQPPADEVIETLSLRAAEKTSHSYQSYNGIPELRRAFSEWYRRYFRVSLDPAGEILPLIGSKEGIMHITMAFVNPGEEVLIPDPGYPAYAAATRLAGGVPRPYSLREENGWLPDLKEIRSSSTAGIKLMWINYPHMPTGAKADSKSFGELVAFARENAILICNDNPYSFILNKDHLSLLSTEGASDVAIELNSLSKSHNMAGWRIGMAAGNRRFISAIQKVKSNMDSGMFLPLQAAAARALSLGDDWYEKLNLIYAERREGAARIMESLGCSFDSKQSGLFLWGRIPERYKNDVELTDRLLYEAGVFITPGFIFGDNGRGYVRISLCADKETLETALRRIEQANIN